MTSTDTHLFVRDLEREHGGPLRRFLATRMRSALADAPDLVQEVFLRMLRVGRHESIRNPEAYLFTVALHVLHQHMLGKASRPEMVRIDALSDELATDSDCDPARHAQTNQQITRLQRAVEQLSPKAQAVLLLHRRDGYSLEEIGTRLGISRAMAAKYLRKALLHCRQAEDGGEIP